MHITALPHRFRQHFPNGCFEPSVIVRNHKLHAAQSPLAQVQKKVPPTRTAFTVRNINRKDLAPAFPVHGDSDEHGLADDNPVFPHAFVTRIQNEIGEGLLEPPFRKSAAYSGARSDEHRTTLLVQAFVDGADHPAMLV
jgi:hypothetical protein